MSIQANFFDISRIGSILWDLPSYVRNIQNYLQILRYTGVKGKNIGAARKYSSFDFFQLKISFVFFFGFVNILCPYHIQKSHSFYKKKLQRLN